MVTDFNLNFEESALILEELKPWMLKIGLVPEIPDTAKIEGLDKEIQKYSLYFVFGFEGGLGVDIHVEGVVFEHKTRHELDGPPLEFHRVREERLEYMLVSCSLEHYVDKIYQEKLHLSELLENYIWSINSIPIDQSEYQRLQNGEGSYISQGPSGCYDHTKAQKAIDNWKKRRLELKSPILTF